MKSRWKILVSAREIQLAYVIIIIYGAGPLLGRLETSRKNNDAVQEVSKNENRLWYN